MIEICTGLAATIRDSTSQPFAFYVSITLPSGAAETPDITLIEELIRVHKPACTGYILEVKR
jgi:hypothetical protein